MKTNKLNFYVVLAELDEQIVLNAFEIPYHKFTWAWEMGHWISLIPVRSIAELVIELHLGRCALLNIRYAFRWPITYTNTKQTVLSCMHFILCVSSLGHWIAGNNHGRAFSDLSSSSYSNTFFRPIRTQVFGVKWTKSVRFLSMIVCEFSERWKLHAHHDDWRNRTVKQRKTESINLRRGREELCTGAFSCLSIQSMDQPRVLGARSPSTARKNALKINALGIGKIHFEPEVYSSDCSDGSIAPHGKCHSIKMINGCRRQIYAFFFV